MALDVSREMITGLVDRQNGLVSRDIFVNPDLYKIEQERIFSRVWLLIGLEDQVKKPGDYFVSRMGEESVILSRGRDNTLHVFLNSCRHRGMKVCRYDEGNTPVFTCPYHGWSYAGDGSLVGVPRYKDAYREELDKSQWGLVEVAQIHNFKGTIWATWDPKAPSFDEYVGDMKQFMGMFLSKPDGTEGELESIGVLKWPMPCNWKLGPDNFIGDNYHGTTTHQSADLLRLSPSGQQGRHTQDNVRVRRLGLQVAHHGHDWRSSVQLEDHPYWPTYPNAPIVEEYYQKAFYRRKELLGDKARVIGNGGTIFPNGTFGTGQSLAVWNPQGLDHTEVWRFIYLQKDAPQGAKDVMRHYIMRYGGPAGLTEEDDMENWNYAHKASKGVIARRHPYNYAMGLGYERPTSDIVPWLVQDGHITENSFTEQGHRALYKFWADVLSSESWDDLRARGLWK